MTIKAIVFDLDGVYFLGGNENFKKNMNAEYGIPIPKIEEVYFKSYEMRAYKEGNLSNEEFWEYAINEWDITATKEEILDLLVNGYEINRKAVKLIENLHRNGYQTAICTNNFPARIRVLQEKFDFIRDFDVAVLSYEEGITKPNPRIYNILKNRLGCEKNEIFITDDNRTNVEKLNDMGFIASLYVNFGTFKNELREYGVNINQSKE